MKHRISSILLAFFLIWLLATDGAQAQFKLGKLKLNEVVKKDHLEAAGKLFDTEKRIEKLREEQLVKDTSFYNYIFSQGNRASFFANRESKESFLYTIGADYDEDSDEPLEFEVYEQIFDLNRKAEFSIYINPQIASFNFIEALRLFTDRSIQLNTVIDIRDYINTDTLSIEEKYAVGKTMSNIAIMVHAQGKYNLSEGMTLQAISFFKEELNEGTIALASLYNNMAVVEQSQGKYADAEAYFNQAQDILINHNKSESLSNAILTSNLALYYNELGRFRESEINIQKAIDMAGSELREKGRDNISFKINKGLIYYSQGKLNEAEQIFNEVLELKRKRMARNQTDYANVENYLAGVLMASEKIEQVPTLLQDALRIFDAKYGTDHPAYIKTKHNLGKYYLYMGNYSDALSIIQEVNTAYESYFGPRHPAYLQSLEDLAVISWKQKDYLRADERFDVVITAYLNLVEENFVAMSEYEKGQYWASIRPSILKYFNYATQRYKEDPKVLTTMYNIQLKTKGILFGTSTRIRDEILGSNNESLIRMYHDWKQSKENLLLYYTYSKKQLKEQNINLVAEENKANQLEKELSRESSNFATANKLPKTTVADIKQRLSPTDVAIETIGFPDFENSFTSGKKYAFLIADPNAEHPSLAILDNGQDLDGKYAKAYRNMVKLKINNPVLYEKYWQSIDKTLGGVKNIHIALDGIYFQVNISALQKPDGSYVADGVNLHLYSSTRELMTAANTESSAKTAEFFGYPDYGNQGLLASLPGTKAEIEAISSITKTQGYKVTSYMEKEATELNFKNISSPNLLHVATHGFFLKEENIQSGQVLGIDVNQAQSNPLLRSGLMLTDAERAMEGSNYQATSEVSRINNGILTAYEVMTLDLKNTELVVLSACETGLGEIKSGEGVYGLQRAFQIAGADAVIMSLWKVSDEATKSLMTTFYKEWMSGKSKGDAFISAQAKIRLSYPEPYYWGAFVLLN